MRNYLVFLGEKRRLWVSFFDGVVSVVVVRRSHLFFALELVPGTTYRC